VTGLDNKEDKAYFKLLLDHSLNGAEENHKKPKAKRADSSQSLMYFLNQKQE
jgi:hypothetical protein